MIKYFTFVFFASAVVFVSGYEAAAEDVKREFKSSLSLNDYLTGQMENPARAAWQKPEKVADYLILKEGDKVADLGAGTGYFTRIFARRVGKTGKVFAIDTEEAMLDFLKKKAGEEGLSNIECILAPPDDPLLPKASVDMVFMGIVYFQIEKKNRYLKILKDVLKENGRLAIVDFNLTDKISNPPVDVRIPRERVLEDFQKAGFTLEAEYFFLPYQYFFIFSKK